MILLRKFITGLLILSCINSVSAQLPFGLYDGRSDGRCVSCIDVIRNRPPEVLFGIDIRTNGDVYFSMTNKEWFNKIFASDINGVTADIVAMDRYDCNKETAEEFALPKGFLLPPVYRPAFKENKVDQTGSLIMIKIGKIPAGMMKKRLEGNLVILNGPYICFYTDFLNIDRNVWQLLPMGLFTDSLINSSTTNKNNKNDFFTYEKKLQVVVPFNKNKAVYRPEDVAPLYDSIDLTNFRIKKIDIRAYSSVEGSEAVNLQLMKKRADVVVNELKKTQPSLTRVQVTAAENWLEFLQDIKNTKLKDLALLSKDEIRRKLTDTAISNQLEPILAHHRKTIVLVYLERKTTVAMIADSSILSDFKKAVDEKNIARARMIQKELVERITDNKLPTKYIDQLEVPMTKDYTSLLGDQQVYKLLLQQTSEYKALENFLEIRKIDSTNGRINYNICALQFFAWQFAGDTSFMARMPFNINKLEEQGIDESLTKRLMINYDILMCAEYMRVYNYAAKDEALEYIYKTYEGIPLTDEDIFSLAKYFVTYAHDNWALGVIAPRVNKLDVSENILFYYINLQFYEPLRFTIKGFEDVLVNAININRQRFCNFFLPNDKGGASMQLLDHPILKKFYCENCMAKPLSSQSVASNQFFMNK